MQRFIDDLKEALESYIEPWMDKGVYIDTTGLGTGDKFNKKIANAICRSVCMILVFVPKYFSEEHPYCQLEYQTMKVIEEKRREVIGEERGLIFPIVFRGPEYLPPQIKDHIQYSDFSSFTLISPEISRNPEFVEEIERIAKDIYKLYRDFEQSGEDPCGVCDDFKLPSGQQEIEVPEQPFPGRQ